MVEKASRYGEGASWRADKWWSSILGVGEQLLTAKKAAPWTWTESLEAEIWGNSEKNIQGLQNLYSSSNVIGLVGYYSGQRRFDSRQRQEFFCSVRVPTQLPVWWILTVPGRKADGREAEYCSVFSAEVKNEWRCTSTSYAT